MGDSFNQNTKLYKIALLVFVIAGVVCLFIWRSEGESGTLHNLQNRAASIFSPLSNAGSKVIDNNEKNNEDNNANSETLSALKEQNSKLVEQIAKGEEYRQEAQRLQELLNLKDNYNIEGVTGRVISRTTDAWNQTCTLDVGEDSGVKVGSTICASYGVVGQVVGVTKNTCNVRLLSDPQSGVAAMIQSSRKECIVKGSLDGLVSAENLDQDCGIQVGDIIITSGLGGSYKKGLIIGTVSKISTNSSDGTLRAIIKQNDNTKFEEALVVNSVGDLD